MQRSPQDRSLINRSSNTNGMTYLAGVALGALVGLFGAFIFKRSEEEAPAGRRPVSNGQIFTVLLSSVTLIRQIAEMGKQQDKKR